MTTYRRGLRTGLVAGSCAALGLVALLACGDGGDVEAGIPPTGSALTAELRAEWTEAMRRTAISADEPSWREVPAIVCDDPESDGAHYRRRCCMIEDFTGGDYRILGATVDARRRTVVLVHGWERCGTWWPLHEFGHLLLHDRDGRVDRPHSDPVWDRLPPRTR